MISHWDFPVTREPFESGNKIISSYVAERTKISSKEELRSFTERWKNVWLAELPDLDFGMPKDFDYENTYHFMIRLKDNKISENPSVDEIAAINILVPKLFAFVSYKANHFEVEEDIIFDQLFSEETLRRGAHDI